MINGGYNVPEYYNVQGAWSRLDTNDTQYVYPIIIVLASTMLTGLCVLLLVNSKSADKLHVFERAKEELSKKFLASCALLMILDLAINIYMRGGILEYFAQNWYLKNTDLLESYGQIFVIYLFFQMALQLVLTAVVALSVRQKIVSGNGGGEVASGIILMLLNMIASGNRVYLALLLLYFACLVVNLKRWKLASKLAVLIPILVLIFSIWAQIRGALSDPLSAIDRHIDTAAAYEGNYILNRLIDVTEGANIIFLLNIIKDFGQTHPFLQGDSFLKAVVFWIPRSVLPDKPESFAVTTAALYESGAETSFSSTIVAELYANFGLLVVLLLPFVTMMMYYTGKSERMPVPYLTRLYSTSAFMVFAWMARANFSDNFVLLIVSYILVYLLGVAWNKRGGSWRRISL